MSQNNRFCIIIVSHLRLAKADIGITIFGVIVVVNFVELFSSVLHCDNWQTGEISRFAELLLSLQ